jgi:hypothetical protein
VFARIGLHWRHRQRLAARALEGVAGIVARDADLPFGLFVIGFEVVVGDGPILERGTLDRAVARTHAEVVGMKAPRHGAIAERAAADAGGVVVVAALAGQDDARLALVVHHHAGVAFVLRTKSVAEDVGALVAQIVLAALPGGMLAPAFEQDDAVARHGEFLGDNGAARARANHDGIDLLKRHTPRPRPRTGTTGMPSIRQLT